MIAAKQRLRDMGFGSSLETDALERVEEEDTDDVRFKAEDEAKLAPWKLTANFVECVGGGCLLAVTGGADPTGLKQEGFSYLRIANKPVTKGSKKEKLLPEIPKNVKKMFDGKMSDKDKDLRKINLEDARRILEQEYGYKRKFLESIDRWQVIHLLR